MLSIFLSYPYWGLYFSRGDPPSTVLGIYLAISVILGFIWNFLGFFEIYLEFLGFFGIYLEIPGIFGIHLEISGIFWDLLGNFWDFFP